MPFQIPHMLQVQLGRCYMQKRSRKEEGKDGICETEPVLSQKKPQLLENQTQGHVYFIQVIPEEQPH